MEPTAATAELPGEVWRRVVIVAAMVSALVGGVVSVAGPTTASGPVPGVPELSVPAPALDPSCRQLIALPKRGWVCVDDR
jgi:hypothetical protein